MSQGVKELSEGFHHEPGMWLFQPGKLSPREAGVGTGSWPAAVSLQTENGKSEARKNSCNSSGFGSCRKPCYFQLTSFSDIPRAPEGQQGMQGFAGAKNPHPSAFFWAP